MSIGYIRGLGGKGKSDTRKYLFNNVKSENTYGWTELPPPNITRSFECVTLSNGENFYVAGRSGGTAGTILSCYNLSTKAWSTKEPLPTVVDGTTLVSYSNYVYFLLGKDLNYIYDTITESYTEIPNIGKTRNWMFSHVFEDKIHCLAGGTSPYTDNYCFDILTQTWSSKPSIPGGEKNNRFIEADFNKIFVIGGSAIPRNQLYMYDILSESWTLLPDGPFSYSDSSLKFTQIWEGILFYIGQNASYRYDISASVWTTLEAPATSLSLFNSSYEYSRSATLDTKLFAISGAVFAYHDIFYNSSGFKISQKNRLNFDQEVIVGYTKLHEGENIINTEEEIKVIFPKQTSGTIELIGELEVTI